MFIEEVSVETNDQPAGSLGNTLRGISVQVERAAWKTGHTISSMAHIAVGQYGVPMPELLLADERTTSHHGRFCTSEECANETKYFSFIGAAVASGAILSGAVAGVAYMRRQREQN